MTTDITREHVIRNIRPIGDGVRVDYVGPDGLWSMLVYATNGKREVEFVPVEKRQLPASQYRD